MALKFNSIEPFIPSGKDFEKSRALFVEIGFIIHWESDGYVDFQKDTCRFSPAKVFTYMAEKFN